MNREIKRMVLSELVDLQLNCSNIVLSIGNVTKDGFVDHDSIIIKECCQNVITKITWLAGEYNFHIDITSEGLRLY